MKAKFLALAALVLGLASCQTEPEGFDVVVGGEVETVINVNLPESDTRAASNIGGAEFFNPATHDIRYILEIYQNGTRIKDRDIILSDNGSVAFPVRLVPGRNYTFVVWADFVTNGSKEDLHYNTDTERKGLTKITLKGDWTAMDETRDAYSGVQIVTGYNGANGIDMELSRPFAKVRVVTTDIAALTAINNLPTAVEIKYTNNVCTTFNALTGAAIGEQKYETSYTLNAVGVQQYTDVTGSQTLYAGYVFANEQASVANFNMSVTLTDLETVDNNFNTSIPVQRNKVTTIYGNLLTTGNDVNVKIENEFEQPENSVNVWDGETVKEPAVDNNIYIIEEPSELAWLAAAVNGTLTEEYTRATVAPNDFAGKTFLLTQDINLGNEAWTPIGNSNNIFKGTFDGQGHTITNLVVNGGSNSNQGLFGVTHDGEIKDFTLENAKVSGRLNVGAVAGQPYTSKYTDITVQGHVEINGMAYVGGVGGKNAYANWTNITVNVDETSYVKANSVENGTAYRTYVGGVVGFNGEGGHSFTYITSNINVEGSTCDVGGLFGIAHYGNQFVNCSCSGNVTITTNEVESALEMGGIAGVWHNENGTTVTLTDCSFTGELSTLNITEDVNFYYGGLVGAPYSENGTGKLIIDGVQYVATVDQLQAAVDAANGETTICFGADIEGDVTVVQKQGVKITIDGKGKKFIGSIKVHSNSYYYDDAALTIKNVNFETSTASVNVIEALENGSERYSQNITVEDCTFTATDAAVNTSVAVQVKATRGVTVTRCTATGMHSLIQAQSCDTGDVKVINSNVNGKNGVAFKQVKSATVEGTTITATGYGIRFDGNIDNYGIVVRSNNVTAAQPFIVRRMTGADNTIALEGTNTLTTEAEFQIVITNGEDDAEYVKPTGTYTLTGADNYTVFPAPFPVASWDEFTAALAAGEDNIKLTADITFDANYQLQKNVTLNLGGFSMTLPMINIHTTTTIKNGTINGKVYARKNSEIVFDGITFSGAVADNLSTEGHLAIQGGCRSLYAKDCLFSPTSVSGSQTKPLSFEGGSTIMKFENCEFKSSPYKKQVYFNPLSAAGSLEFINCNFNNKTPNIMFAAACPLTNLRMSGTTKLSSVTLETNRAKDAVTAEDLAYLRESLIANNSMSQVRLFYAGGSSEYIR